MNTTTKLWLAAPLTLGLVLAGCGGDDDDDAAAEATDAPATAAAEAPEATTPAAEEEAPAVEEDAEPEGGAGAAVIVFGGEEIPIASVRCWFQEQPRAGLGGVFTHTLQASGTNADGESVLLDVSRARAEDGTVEDDVLVDIGEIGAEDMLSLRASGPEGLVTFGEASAMVDDLELTAFDADPATLSFDLACG